MRELHGHTGVWQLWHHDRLLPCLLLEWDDVVGELVLLRVVRHVEETETYLAQASVGCHEVAALHDALYQLVWQWLARLVMEGEGAEEVLLHRIVLHKLGWQLHEVPPYVGARETLEASVGEHAVQAVSKLVEEGLYLAQCQEGWLLLGRFGEVHHYTHMRAHIVALVVDPLSLELCHPSSSLLTLAREKVGVEDGEITAILVEHLVCLHVWVIDWDVLVLLEGDAVELVGKSEHAIDHLVQLEVRAEHLGIEVELLHLQLMGVVTEVPWLDVEVVALQFLGKCLYLSHLLHGGRLVGGDEVVQELIYVVDIRSHTMLQHVVGVGIETEQLG